MTRALLFLLLTACGGSFSFGPPQPGTAVGTCKALPADEPQGCVEGTSAVYCDGTESLPADAMCTKIDAPDGGSNDYGIWCCE